MRRFTLLLITVYVLVHPATSWGPTAHEIFCQDAVSKVWGQQALPCLNDKIQYCIELKQIFNETVKQRCLDAYASGVVVNPSTAPLTLFQDFEKHHNYDSCPLAWVRPSKEFICSGEGNPAMDEARMWFEAAEKSQDVCEQVRLFCTGSFYYTSAYFPLHQVKYLKGCLGGPLDLLVDTELASGKSNWTVKDQCTFIYLKQYAGVSRLNTQHVTFILDEENFNAVQSNLTFAAQYVRNPQLMPPTTTTIPTTSTTMPPQPLTGTTVSTILPTITTISMSTTTTQPTVVTSPTTSSTITSTTTLPPTTTTSPPREIMDPELNESLVELDTIFEDMLSTINKTQPQEQPPHSNNVVALVVLVIVVVVSLALLVHLYTIMRRPTIHPSRKVVLPPSVRRKMKKAR